MRADEHLFVEAARVVLKRFPASVVINARPGGDGPAVVYLPVERTHVVRHDSAKVLRADLDALGLQDLTDVEERIEVLRLGVLAQHVLAYELIAARVLLVREHYGRLYVVIRRHGVSIDRFD